jgi:leucyl-tRNA synthetase
LANDEVVNGVSERGGHPVIKKKMRQWYLRITDYADRLLEGLNTVNFSDSMKEMQRNWIGKSEGCEMEFSLTQSSDLTPNPSPKGEGGKTSILTTDPDTWELLKDFARENRKENTTAEDILWQRLRNNQLGSKVRRQHVIEDFIIDFAFLNEKLLIEVDGGYHNEEQQKIYDDMRTHVMGELGYEVLRLTNEEVEQNIEDVLTRISFVLNKRAPLSLGRGAGGEVKEVKTIKVYTTRPDTIFGVDFLVLAPEHELVNQITTDEQRKNIDDYLTYVKSRSDRERMSEVKQITGCFTGAYAENPFNGKQIPVWIAEYVLVGYGTGAIMAVPCGDQRDFLFAQHFNIPITNIIGEHFNGKEANPTKEAKLSNSDFLNGVIQKDAIAIVNEKMEAMGIFYSK